MLKFFRKIRQSLLVENQFNKYLLYAIGEIVLVVIGILLALQINNWNEAKQERIEEEKLLLALLEDFSENKIRLENTIDRETNVIDMSKSLIQAMQSKDKNVDPESVKEWVASGAKSWWKTDFVTGTYDAMLSSGKIGILKNDDLKSALSQFAAEINTGFEDHTESLNYLIEMNKISADITPALIHEIQGKELGIITDKAELALSVAQLLDNEDYLGLLISKTWLETLRIHYQRKLQTYVEDILTICQSELE